MDFTFTPEQDEAAALAARILGDHATNERMKAVEADGSRFDRELWGELGSAGLPSLAVPEGDGGAGRRTWARGGGCASCAGCCARWAGPWRRCPSWSTERSLGCWPSTGPRSRSGC